MTGQLTGTRRIVALVLLGGVFVMEGYDIAAMSLAVPRLEAALGLAPDLVRLGVHRAAGRPRRRAGADRARSATASAGGR